MSKKTQHVSETPATQFLRQHKVAFTEHVYEYVEHGGTAESARQLGVDEHAVVKTLVMQDERAQPLIVLMHGDKQVSTKNLARGIGVTTLAQLDENLDAWGTTLPPELLAQIDAIRWTIRDPAQ